MYGTRVSRSEAGAETKPDAIAAGKDAPTSFTTGGFSTEGARNTSPTKPPDYAELIARFRLSMRGRGVRVPLFFSINKTYYVETSFRCRSWYK